jgi:hypothetical protein
MGPAGVAPLPPTLGAGWRGSYSLFPSDIEQVRLIVWIAKAH